MISVWSIVGLTILLAGMLLVLVKRYKLRMLERFLTQTEINDETWTDMKEVTVIGVHYKSSSFKRLDELLSQKNKALGDVVVFLDAPPFIHLLKQRAWSYCLSVRHIPEWTHSSWIALLDGETAAYQWDGHKLHRYTEVEMFLELKIRLSQSEEGQICTQQSVDNF